jgi:NADH:ubiquinone oxidoreductase subunit F (NADH-binding)
MSFEPVLLARIGKADSPKLEGYRADGGYASFERALKEKKPEEVTTQVKDSGLRTTPARSTSASTPTNPSPARTTTAS